MLSRLVVSALLGMVVVAGLLAGGVAIYEFGREHGDPVFASPVELLTGSELIEVGKLLGEDWDPDRRRLPPPPSTAPMLPPRQVSGFVQLEFDVDTEGRVGDIEIVGATPAGVFEDEARARIESQRFAPLRDALGRPLPSRRTEIVDFSMPAVPAGARSQPDLDGD